MQKVRRGNGYAVQLLFRQHFVVVHVGIHAERRLHFLQALCVKI